MPARPGPGAGVVPPVVAGRGVAAPAPHRELQLGREIFAHQVLRVADARHGRLVELDDYVLDMFARLTEDYEQDKHVIPKDRLVEWRYEDFIKDPIAAMRDTVTIPTRSLRVRSIIGAVVVALGSLALLGGVGSDQAGAGAALVGLGAVGDADADRGAGGRQAGWRRCRTSRRSICGA